MSPADHIHLARTREVSGGGALVSEALGDNMAHPRQRRLVPEDRDSGCICRDDVG